MGKKNNSKKKKLKQKKAQGLSGASSEKIGDEQKSVEPKITENEVKEEIEGKAEDRDGDRVQADEEAEANFWRGETPKDKDGGTGAIEQDNRGLWETLNAEYPWVKVAIALTVVLFVLGFWKMRFWPKPVLVTETRGFYAELGLKPPVKKRDLKGKKLIALTFDDGPAPATTLRLLDILKEKKVPVTFFVLGIMARNYPDIVKREVAEGHELASHTTNHADLSKMSIEQIQQDMNESCRILSSITGKCAELVRPPYGAINGNVTRGIAKPLVIWSVDTEDWKSHNVDRIRAEVKKSSFDGAVVLFHDIYGTTVDAIPIVIDDLRAAGYEFVTISEMAQARGVKLEQSEVYGVFRP